MSGFNECVEKILAITDGKLSRREAGELLRKFNKSTENMSLETRIESMDVLLTQAREKMIKANDTFDLRTKRIAMQEELTSRTLVSRMNESINRTLKKDAEGKIIPGQIKNVKKATDDLMYGSPGSRQGLIQAWEGARLRFTVALAGQLEKQELLSHWGNKETIEQAIDVVWGDPSHASAEAQKIGTILKSIQQLGLRRLNTLGAYVLDTPRLLFSAKAADPAKIRSFGKESFISFVNSLDLDHSYFEGLDDSAIADYWDKTYTRLAEGRQYQAPTGQFDGISGLTKEKYRNLAASNSIDYDIPFASANAFKQYAAAFSSDPLQVLIQRRVDQIGRSVGLMEAFGPTPEATLRKVLKKFEGDMSPEDIRFLLKLPAEDAPPKSKFEAVTRAVTAVPKRFVSWTMDAHPEDALAYMSGLTSAPVDITGARIGAGVRSWASMSSLGGGLFMQLTDMPTKVAQLISYGKDPFDTVLGTLTAVGNSFPDAERKALYTQLGISADLLRNQLAEQVGSIGYQNHMISRMMDSYFKLNGMAWIDRVQKQHTADTLSQSLAWALRGSKEGAPILDLFRSYGFADEDFTKMATVLGKVQDMDVLDPVALSHLDDVLYEKYLGTMNDLISTMTPTAGVREKAVTLKGTRPGTWQGEFLRTTMMFKSYPMMLLNRVYPNIQFEHGIGGTAATMLSMAMMWYIGDSMKALATGRTPRDMSKTENIVRMITGSGAGGIYADLLSANYNSYGMDLWSVLGGPVAGKTADLAKFGAATVRGEATFRQTASTVRSNLPSIFWEQTVLDRMLIYGIMEMGDPGVTDRTFKNLQEKTGQQRIY